MSKQLACLDSAALKQFNEKQQNDSNNTILETDTRRGYKSGAIYNGQVIDNNKFGKGVFIWPNSDRYEGSYEFNYRHGYG